MDEIRLGVDGINIGATLKITETDGDGAVLTQKGSVAAHGESAISVTHGGDHCITIFSRKGVHCENMPTKAGKSIIVKDDVYVFGFPARIAGCSRRKTRLPVNSCTIV